MEDDQLFIKKGEMIKNPLTMTNEELAVWEMASIHKIRERLSAIGQPLVYKT